MASDMTIHLVGEENEDGSFNAWVEVEGKRMASPEFSVVEGQCEDVSNIVEGIRAAYPNAEIIMDGPISTCFQDGYPRAGNRVR